MKKQLLASVVAQLQAELDHLRVAVKAALDAATSEESKPENQYDTRALEASYLAAAQGKRLQELQRMIEILREFPEIHSEVATSGSLLEISSDAKVSFYFLLPFGAGLSAEAGTQKATVVSLDSPLGKLLLGRRSGDSVEFSRAGATKDYEILKVL